MAQMIEVLLPQMGEGVHEATLTNWLVAEGQKVDKDKPLFEVSTDKVDTEIPSPASGYLARIVVPVGSTAQVNQCLAYIATDATAATAPLLIKDDVEDSEAAVLRPHSSAETSAPASKPAQHDESADDTGHPSRSSPLVRKMAKDRGIDLNSVKGSGLYGRITKKDILELESSPPRSVPVLSSSPAAVPVSVAAASAQASEPTRLKLQNLDGQEYLEGVAVRRETMSRMRQLIADHMIESVRVSPHVTTVFEMDLHRISTIREKYKDEFFRQEGFKLTLTHFFIHAAVQAIKKHPIVNVSVDGNDILWKKDINVGCAVALDNGLIVPVIKQAGDLSLLGIARRLNDLVVRARSKKLKPEDVQGGTFSITNPGGWGSITSNPIINQPQVAILGIGAAVKRPVVVDDMIAIRPMMYMSLTFDHRVIDGEGGAKYLATLKDIIESYDELPT